MAKILVNAPIKSKIESPFQIITHGDVKGNSFKLFSFKSAYSNTCKYTTVCMYTKLQVQVSLALCMTKWLGQHRRPLFSLKYEVRGERLRSSQNVYPLCRGMDAKACQGSQIPGYLIGSTKGEYTQCFVD